MLKSIKNFINKNKLYILDVITMLVIINLIFLINNIYPYKNNTLINSDFYHQYAPMLNELFYRIKNGKSLVYSFQDGLGMPIYRNFFNYLASPFNIIILFTDNLILGCHLIIAFKIIAISLTTLYYLKKKFNTDNILLIIPAIIFSLCGWISSYYFNIMWIDSLILLPLITLGIEKLVTNHNCKLYIFSLAIMIITNYYMAYMVCIYSLIYFLIYNLYKIKDGSIKYKINELSRNFLIFMGTSATAVLLTSFMMMPLMYASSTMTAKLDVFTNEMYYNFNIIDFLAGHLALTNNTALTSNPINPTCPNIYSGLISIILLIPFILDKKINNKTKILYISLLIIFSLFFFIPLFDYIINMFHIPADFPYRYSFMYTFILINILAYELVNLKEIKIKNILISLIPITLIITLIIIFKTNKISTINIYYNLIFIALIYISILLNKKYKIGKYLLIIITALEFILSFNHNGTYLNISKINKLQNKYNITLNNNEVFYRSEVIDDFHNLPLYNNYYGISHSSSMNYSKIFELLYALGNKSDISAYINYLSDNPVTNMLFNIKYTLNNEKIIENKYTLPLMFGINKKINLNYNENFFLNQNNLIKDLTKVENIFTEVKYTNKNIIYEDENYIIYKYTYKDNTYLKFNASNIAFVSTDNKIYTIYDIKSNYNIDNLNKINYKYPFIIKIYNNELLVCFFKDTINEDDITTYILNTNKLNHAYEYLNNDLVNITKFKENKIEATINASIDEIIFTSIPFDKGWEVFIDDKEVETYKNLDCLLSFNIPKGTHRIKLKYHVPYFKQSLIVSIVTLIIIVLYSFYNKYLH